MKQLFRSILAFCLLPALIAVAGCVSTGSTNDSTVSDVREIPKNYLLHSAAQEGRTEAAINLIRAGEDVNAEDKEGWTPLHYAVAEGHTETATALIGAGADIEAKNKRGSTPLFLTASERSAKVATALIQAGADVNAQDISGFTPLHRIASWGNAEIVIALIEAGADVNAKGSGRLTPLHKAAETGQAEIAAALINEGADVNAKSHSGYTPLHFAAANGDSDTVIVLIQAGAYLSVVNNNGWIPLEIAKYRKNWSAVAILQNPPRANRPQPTQPPQGESAPNVAIAPPPETAGTAEFVFENAWRSIVFITDSEGQGSGVIIHPNIVATNCHVIEGGNIKVYKATNRSRNDSEAFPATVRRWDEDNDFCLLDVPGLWGIPANVRKYDTLRIGENVYGIGAPQGFDLSISSGLISQLRVREGNREIIQTDAAISPGASGGGLFDREGNLIGIMTFKLIKEGVEGIGFAIPADLALE